MTERKKLDTVHVVRGVIDYDGSDLLSGWTTDAGAAHEVSDLEDHDRTCNDENCSRTHYGDGHYFIEAIDVFHQEPLDD